MFSDSTSLNPGSTIKSSATQIESPLDREHKLLAFAPFTRTSDCSDTTHCLSTLRSLLFATTFTPETFWYSNHLPDAIQTKVFFVTQTTIIFAKIFAT